MKQLNWALVVCFLAMQYALWIGDKNYFDLQKLRQATVDVRTQNTKLSERNDQLSAEVADIKQGGETVETLVRSQLGWIKQDEVFYQIIE